MKFAMISFLHLFREGGFVIIVKVNEGEGITAQQLIEMVGAPIPNLWALRAYGRGYFFHSKAQARELLRAANTSYNSLNQPTFDRFQLLETWELPEESPLPILSVELDAASILSNVIATGERAVPPGARVEPTTLPWMHFMHLPFKLGSWSGLLGETRRDGESVISAFHSRQQGVRLIRNMTAYPMNDRDALITDVQKSLLPEVSSTKPQTLTDPLARIINGYYSIRTQEVRIIPP